MGRGIPERWQDYSKIGLPIASDSIKTRFIAFKVPLKPELTRALDDTEKFAPADLIEELNRTTKKIGLIIDLTFTKRYYNPQCFTKLGIEYMKIPIEGEMVPKKARIERFAEVVNDFLSKIEDEDVLIGVHCTHGVNRTGYVICKYLVDKGLCPEDVIQLFKECRGHNIERDTYIQHLLTGKLPETELRSYNDGSYRDDQWKNVVPKNITDSTATDALKQTNQPYRMYDDSRSGFTRYNQSGESRYNDYSQCYANRQTPHNQSNNRHDRQLSEWPHKSYSSGQGRPKRYNPYFNPYDRQTNHHPPKSYSSSEVNSDRRRPYSPSGNAYDRPFSNGHPINHSQSQGHTNGPRSYNPSGNSYSVHPRGHHPYCYSRDPGSWRDEPSNRTGDQNLNSSHESHSLGQSDRGRGNQRNFYA